MDYEGLHETIVNICWELQPHNSVVYILHTDGGFQAISQNTQLKESTEGDVSEAIKNHTLDELRYLADYCPGINMSACSYSCDKFNIVVVSGNPSKKDRILVSLFSGILRKSCLTYEIEGQHV
nr:MAG TPA: hypothetical protein [Caudoviricetes sp.]